MDGDRRGARGRTGAGVRVNGAAAADVGARGRGGGDRACPLPLSSPAARCARCAYDDPVAHYLVERVQQEYVQRYGGRDAPSSTRPSSCRRAACSWSPRWTACRPAAGPGGCTAPGVVEIKRVYVEPAFRRRGLAQLIMGALEETRGPRPGTARSC